MPFSKLFPNNISYFFPLIILRMKAFLQHFCLKLILRCLNRNKSNKNS